MTKETANAQHDTTVPRAKVIQIAESFHQLMTLRDKQAHTQAQMIRGCLQAIRKANEPMPFADVKERRKRNEDRDLALLYLESLATTLEDQTAGHKGSKP